jgi:hypothetical protein
LDLDVDDIFISLGDSDFYGTWQPFSEKYLTIVMQHEFITWGSTIHDDEDSQTNPDNLMNSVSPGFEYGIVEETFRLTGGYWQTLPIFTVRDTTNFNYHVSTDNEAGFDVYFVPDLGTAAAQSQSTQQVDFYPGCSVADVNGILMNKPLPISTLLQDWAPVDITSSTKQPG